MIIDERFTKIAYLRKRLDTAMEIGEQLEKSPPCRWRNRMIPIWSNHIQDLTIALIEQSLVKPEVHNV